MELTGVEWILVAWCGVGSAVSYLFGRYVTERLEGLPKGSRIVDGDEWEEWAAWRDRPWRTDSTLYRDVKAALSEADSERDRARKLANVLSRDNDRLRDRIVTLERRMPDPEAVGRLHAKRADLEDKVRGLEHRLTLSYAESERLRQVIRDKQDIRERQARAWQDYAGSQGSRVMASGDGHVGDWIRVRSKDGLA